MKNICIITGSDLRMVMGVNYYLKSFIQCNNFFKNVKLRKIYSGVQTLDIDKGEEMPIGTDIGTAEYKMRRGFRTLLRKLLTDKYYRFALFRYETNLRMVSKRAVESFFTDDSQCDCIIFQEFGVAEYYFKHIQEHQRAKKIKAFLVVHSEGDSRKSLLAKYSAKGNEVIQRHQIRRRDYVYSHIDKVIYISKRALNSSALPIEKRTYVYNGVPNIDYSFSNNVNDIIQFVCVGSIAGIKGEEKILEAIALMDQETRNKIHMTFVGGGQKLDETKEMASNLGISNVVTFLGVRKDVPQILKNMDVFIMPSITEGLSMSAIEAMRAGLYLVLTDTGGNCELCEDGCGVICTREPENILARMKEIIEGGILCKEQKEHSHNRFVKLFSTKGMAEGYERTLMSL